VAAARRLGCEAGQGTGGDALAAVAAVTYRIESRPARPEAFFASDKPVLGAVVGTASEWDRNVINSRDAPG
jgi:hypothetical protein